MVTIEFWSEWYWSKFILEGPRAWFETVNEEMYEKSQQVIDEVLVGVV